MYSQTLWAHARNPKNRGRLEEASAVGKSRYAKCGDDFTLYLLIDAERIVGASFEARACAPVVAVGSVGTCMLHGLTPTEARKLSVFQLDEAVGQLPGPKRHAIWMFLEAMHLALDAWSGQENFSV